MASRAQPVLDCRATGVPALQVKSLMVSACAALQRDLDLIAGRIERAAEEEEEEGEEGLEE